MSDITMAAFSNAEDPLLAGLWGEIARRVDAYGRVEAAYAETLVTTASQYLVRRYGCQRQVPRVRGGLALWQRRRVGELSVTSDLLGPRCRWLL
ncbi:hypothetical protein [Rhodovarius lipocyclicus]|uniref:hypothetical protein n=1 Tax=Rhodovarius lipocyclicus TaxID=268410 RepID=UPI00135A9A29|nr:hypothetical protein [Rhodovarius lipocyclicus]